MSRLGRLFQQFGKRSAPRPSGPAYSRNGVCLAEAPTHTKSDIEALGKIVSALRVKEREFGSGSLNEAEHQIIDVYYLALYTSNKSGFETYFAVVDEPNQWVRAQRALCAMQREDAAAVLGRAISLYVRHDHDSDYLSEMHLYLLEMGHLDHEFDENMRGFEVTLRLFVEGAGRDRI